MTSAGASSTHPLAALRFRDFRLFWGGAVISLVGTQMQMAAVAWQVYLLTHSPVALGLIGLVRVVPIVGFSLIAGVLADVINRRRLLLLTESSLLAVSALLALATFTGLVNIWIVYALTAIGASAYAFDMPARQALVPSLVTAQRLPNALSLMSMAFEAGSILGPAAAGFIIAAGGVGPVYTVDVVSYLAVLAALLVIRPPAVEGAIARISIKAAVEGLHFVWKTPIILSTMTLDFVANFFGAATALLPIFAREVLHVGSAGYGLLYAAPSMGAILAGIGMSFYAASIRAQGATILVSVAFYGLFTALFGFSHVFLLSLVALAGVGASDTVSTILRQTVRQIATPDALRGRMTSVNMIFFAGGPQLGEVEAGVVARAFGAPISVMSGGLIAFAVTLVVAVFARRLRDYQR